MTSSTQLFIFVRAGDIVADVKQLDKVASNIWKSKAYPSTYLGRHVGNIYTGSLYAGLISLIHAGDLANKKVLLFSYGSGLASSMFLIRGRGST